MVDSTPPSTHSHARRHVQAVVLAIVFAACGCAGEPATPTFLWAQQRDHVIVTVGPVSTGVSSADVKFRDHGVAVAIGETHVLDLELLFPIDHTASVWAIERGDRVVLKMAKSEKKRKWARLLRDEFSPLRKYMKVDFSRQSYSSRSDDDDGGGDDNERSEAGSRKHSSTAKGKKSSNKKKLGWVFAETKENLGCMACSKVVAEMEAELHSRRQGNETILVERRKKKTSIPYAESEALVSDLLDEICELDRIWDKYSTVRRSGVTSFVLKSQAGKKAPRRPAAKDVLRQICKSIVDEFEKELTELFFSKRRKRNFNFEYKVCNVLTKACEDGEEENRPPAPTPASESTQTTDEPMHSNSQEGTLNEQKARKGKRKGDALRSDL